MTATLSLTGVSSFYGAVQALRDVDLEVNPGEIVTLIGANGAGKSTLMMTVCGNPTGALWHDQARGRRYHQPAHASDHAPRNRAVA
jgi:branched-chain amino acid transport system ATP-binding protein